MKLLVTLLLVILFVSVNNYAYAQTNTTPTIQQPQIVTTSSPSGNGTDLTLGAGGLSAAAVTALVTLWQQGKLKKADKTTDKDVGLSVLNFYRLIQTMDALIPAVTKCLDQPFNSDPMQKHITIRMKLAEDANGWADYLKTSLNAAVPSMTPSSTVVVTDAQNTTTKQAAAQ